MNTQLIVSLNQTPYFPTKNHHFHHKNSAISSPPFNSFLTSWKLHAQSTRGFSNNSSRSTSTKNVKKKKKTDHHSLQEPTQTALNPISSNPQTGRSGGGGGGGGDDEIPQVVFERMIVRILAYVGVPIAIGFALLQLVAVLREKQIWDVPIWVSFLTTFVTFGSSTLGVAYGALSTSWDPHKEGSLLGLNEARQNWVEMWREDNNTAS